MSLYEIMQDILKPIFNDDKNYEKKLLKKYGKCRETKKYNLKILFITDTHGMLYYEKDTVDYMINLKDYDCCILLGDHSANDLEIIKNIIPNEKLYGVLGNHDGWNLYKDNGIMDINGQVISINGVKIAGICGSYKYKNFKECAMYTHEESVELANKMEKADILVSHDKPFTKSEYGESHDGLKGITEYIYKNHISIHIHGHIHEESEEILKNGTKCICLYKVKLLEL